MDNSKKLKFLIRVLTDTVGDDGVRIRFFDKREFPDEEALERVLSSPVCPDRNNGTDWPERAHTMIGLLRMQNLLDCLDRVREDGIEGDFIETGVWRGGACIFACLYFDMYGMDRKVFVADSFQGLPPPEIPEDDGDGHHKVDFLRVSLDEVLSNFRLYGCNTDRVKPIKGWFSDTLPGNESIGKLCILRMDGDMYKSTMDVFDSCYKKVSENGFVIVDDYCLKNCRRATEDFRERAGIVEPFTTIDPCGIFWRVRRNQE
jgi:hypothetical protein